MLEKILVCCLLGAAALPAAFAGEVILVAGDTALPKEFTCGDGKKLAAGKYDLEVTFEPTPTAHSTLKISKAGKALCSVEGSGTTLHDKMSTSKTRLFSRFDSDRKATEIIVITPTGMRAKVRNQVFYLPETAAAADH
jgi:hypothetical protein